MRSVPDVPSDETGGGSEAIRTNWSSRLERTNCASHEAQEDPRGDRNMGA